jgi:hypothetical protein
MPSQRAKLDRDPASHNVDSTVDLFIGPAMAAVDEFDRAPSHGGEGQDPILSKLTTRQNEHRAPSHNCGRQVRLYIFEGPGRTWLRSP